MAENLALSADESSSTKMRRELARIIDELGAPAPLHEVERHAANACAPFNCGSPDANTDIQREIGNGFLVLDSVTGRLTYRAELIDVLAKVEGEAMEQWLQRTKLRE